MRVYIAFGLIMVFAGAVVFQLCRVQFQQGQKWRDMAKKMSARYQNVEAAHGNIFAHDGSLLATSVPEYTLRMDMQAGAIADDKLFDEKVDSLAYCFSHLFGDRSTREYVQLLKQARNDGNRYQLIQNHVSFTQLKQVRTFPLINLGKARGGLLLEEQNKRILPFRELAKRTIGYRNTNGVDQQGNAKAVSVGLEGAFANYINGENGKLLMQRVPGGTWVPVNGGDAEISPKEGSDIISTLDVNLQDVAQSALKKKMEISKAEHGCVVLMEVATGEIRAIANFTQTKTGDYEEKLNYAISDAAEPGSTFKLATYMTLLEQHKIDTSTQINVEGGKMHVIPGNEKYTVTDAELDKFYQISAKRAFEESSNVAAAKFVYDHFKDDPSDFTNALYSYHLNDKLDLQIPGEGSPLIKTPHSRSWSKLTLPQMAYGYEEKLTPLQMLCFYNAVANNGKMIAPIFVKEIRRLNNTVEQFQARVINEKICSDETLNKVKGLLEGVVQEGTGKTYIKNPLYTVAGKTGTAQIANGNHGYGEAKKHQASFCGYFPADHPKYSMIVVINDPKGEYLAAKVAGPVFRAIADRVYSSDLEMNQSAPLHYVGNTQMPKSKSGNRKAVQEVYARLNIKPLYASNTTAVDTSGGVAAEAINYPKGSVPDVTGMGLSDALFVLGNAGYKVTARGSGAVIKQSVTGGSLIPKGAKITIELQ